jgi:DNA-binding MarR family transcriptional regulator
MIAFNHNELDEVVHAPVRLGVLAYLVTAGSEDFTALRDRLDVTDGNLSIHLKKLEEAGYVGVVRKIIDRKTRTTVKITAAGRAAFVAYLDEIGKLARPRKS